MASSAKGLERTSAAAITSAAQPCPPPHPFVIAVAGGTASGKTTVCDLIIQRLHDQCCVIVNQDAFYKVLAPEERRAAAQGAYNFDAPEAIDQDAMCTCVDGLIAGQACNIPIYDFATHSRRSETRRVDPADVIIIEGILALHLPWVLQRANMKVFVDTDDDVRLARRIQRDVAERGRDVAGVIHQYTTFVKPSFDRFIAPSRRVADIIVPWQRGDNLVAVDLIVEHLKASMPGHPLRRRFANLHMLPSTFQIRGMHTKIRNAETSKDEFIFMADRLIRLVVEYALGLLPYHEHTVTTPTSAPYQGIAFTRKLCGVSIIRSGESMESALRTCCKGIDIGKILVQRTHHRSPPASAASTPSPTPGRVPTGPSVSGHTPQKPHFTDVHGSFYNGTETPATADCADVGHLIYEKLPRDIADRHVLLLDPILGSGRTVRRAMRVLLDKGVHEDHILFLTLIAAPCGVERVCSAFPGIKVITTEIDQDVDSSMRVVPGVGEFGDRYFCC